MRSRSRLHRALRRIAPAAALALGAALLAPAAALACGGFFCFNQTMDQAAEEIYFGVDPESGTVRAEIRIFYEGDAADFGWVLPIPNVPELSVGSEAVFEALRARTRPTFTLELDPDSQECMWRFRVFPAAAESSFDDADAGGGPPSVVVLDSGQVGAFDYVVLESSDGSALVDWLNDNGFVQPPTAAPLMDHYIAQNMVFVALKLQQSAGSGDITPVVLHFKEDAPCVPLVLTQIAAQPDMPVRLWVASTARSVPNNWLEVEPNLAKIDWLNNGWNYNELSRDAIQEAAIRGFVTDYAGPSDILQDAFYVEGQYDLAALAQADGAREWVTMAKNQFPPSATLLAVFQHVAPVPEGAGVWEQDFYNFEWEYEHLYEQIDFDAEAATAYLDERMVTPLRDAQQVADRFPYLTRLTTIISPENMTRDPIFKFNSGLGDVPRERVAQGKIQCDGNVITDVQITLPSGSVIKPQVPNWWGASEAYTADDIASLPNAQAVHLVPEVGPRFQLPSELIAFADDQLNTQTAEQLIASLTDSGVAPGTPPGTPAPPSGSTGRSSGGCAAGGDSPAPLALAALALLLLARRRD